MTTPQAQQLVSDLIGAGYQAWASQAADGDWRVQTVAPSAVDQPTVAAFAAQHSAKVQSYAIATTVSFG